MPLVKYSPPPPLGQFVDCFWWHCGFTFPHDYERCLPDGGMEMVISLQADDLRVYDRDDPTRFEQFTDILLCGAHSEAFIIDTLSQAAILGIHFRPGGAFPFLGVPASELHNLHLSLESLWGERAAELRHRLVNALTPHHQFQILEQALLQKATRPLMRHPAVAFALNEMKTFPSRALSDITAPIGLSQKQFIHRFNQEVGLTPKLFHRVRRFQQVVQGIGTTQEVDWTEVALACGYFDQAHFIHDFRDFSGLTPSAYLAQPRDRLNHVPL